MGFIMRRWLATQGWPEYVEEEVSSNDGTHYRQRLDVEWRDLFPKAYNMNHSRGSNLNKNLLGNRREFSDQMWKDEVPRHTTKEKKYIGGSQDELVLSEHCINMLVNEIRRRMDSEENKRGERRERKTTD